MNKLDKIIMWDWAQRLFWALFGIIVFCFALGFTYDELPAADKNCTEKRPSHENA
jgi:hypothetical protein